MDDWGGQTRDQSTGDESTEDESTEGGSRAGPTYDAVLKAIFEADLAGACRLLGVPLNGEPEALSAEFTLTSRKVDLLARVGPGRLMHVEYARRATSDLVARMLVYRGLIMKRHPKHHVSQHIVVLGEGTVDGHDDFAQNDFAVNLRLLYLRDADPRPFVDDANFAPLAILHRGDPMELEQVATKVVGAIREHGGDRVERLLEFSTMLAPIASDVSVVERIIKGTEMSLEEIAAFYRESGFGRILRDEGREEGREELLADLLVERFGEHSDLAGLAHRLAAWKDGTSAVHAITTATGLDDLRHAEPSL